MDSWVHSIVFTGSERRVMCFCTHPATFPRVWLPGCMVCGVWGGAIARCMVYARWLSGSKMRDVLVWENNTGTTGKASPKLSGAQRLEYLNYILVNDVKIYERFRDEVGSRHTCGDVW